MINQVLLDGVIVSDIELRSSTKKGTPVVDFRICNREPKAKNPVFIDVEVWGRQAEMVAENASRNTRVLIKGEMRMDNWESRDTGEKRSKHKITADKVIFLESQKFLSKDSDSEFAL